MSVWLGIERFRIWALGAGIRVALPMESLRTRDGPGGFPGAVLPNAGLVWCALCESA